MRSCPTAPLALRREHSRRARAGLTLGGRSARLPLALSEARERQHVAARAVGQGCGVGDEPGVDQEADGHLAGVAEDRSRSCRRCPSTGAQTSTPRTGVPAR